MDVSFKDNVKERISQQGEKYKYVIHYYCPCVKMCRLALIVKKLYSKLTLLTTICVDAQ